ncbi:MAG: archease [Polyangiaceae bacterium]
MIWIEARAESGSRIAIVRCAIDLLRFQGIHVDAATSWSGPGRRAAHLRGDDVAGALANVRRALDDRVTFVALAEAPPDAQDPLENGVFEDAFPTEAIDHTADEAFAVTAPDRAELLAGAAEALGGLIVSPASVRALASRPVAVTAPEDDWPDDERLHAWLAEVLYTLDAGRFALRRAVIFEDAKDAVRGAIFGEPLDEERHEIHGAIKAVTYHGLAIDPVPGGLRATVIVDV